MSFNEIGNLEEKARVLIYVNNQCPSHSPPSKEILTKFAEKENTKVFSIKDNKATLGYIVLSIKDETLVIHALYSFPEYRQDHKFTEATTKFAEQVAKQHLLKKIECETVLPAMAKYMNQVFGYNLTYTPRKDVF